jgi:hypothetical protein
MSVYEEIGAGYLTRTKDLNLYGGEVVSPRQRSLGDVCLRSKQGVSCASIVVEAKGGKLGNGLDK